MLFLVHKGKIYSHYQNIIRVIQLYITYIQTALLRFSLDLHFIALYLKATTKEWSHFESQQIRCSKIELHKIYFIKKLAYRFTGITVLGFFPAHSYSYVECSTVHRDNKYIIMIRRERTPFSFIKKQSIVHRRIIYCPKF